MSTTHNPKTDATLTGSPQPGPVTGDALPSAMTATEGWVPEDRAPSAAESNFMSFALFAFLILFGIGCFIIF